ncbi:unnamed protein product [Cladocopium goreaui]|uniref:Uncharacterized protein n=1 Tax=Cladocopium goreaui TaxID=2562237 RepID=A0A9P1GCH5_9DINO|nr:unnamed protein product [Cladocopium goreaui]
MDVERIRQQLKPGLGTVLQEAFKPRGRTSRRSTGALPAWGAWGALAMLCIWP